ncbi:MAG TPA: hypothetical protein DD440_00220, partial [Porticoccaceae bacterium]|nr:hypothetical protein [Porticoccaceae bacterium]
MSIESSEISQMQRGRAIDRWAKRAVVKQLKQLTQGRLTVVDGKEVMTFGDLTADDAPLATTIEVLDQKFYSEFALG